MSWLSSFLGLLNVYYTTFSPVNSVSAFLTLPSSRPPTRGGEFKIGCETLAVVRLLSCAENSKRTTTRCARRRFRCRSLPPHWRLMRFTVQRRWPPKEDGRYDSTSFYDLSIPPRGFFAEIPASDPSRSSLRFHEKGVAIGARAYPQSVPRHTHNRLACFP